MNLGHTSKSSPRLSPSSSKSLFQFHEITKLQNNIETLNQNNENLKKSLESRDNTIGIIAREKDKLFAELKYVQRTNRNLYQQLMDERDIHFKEKEYLVDDIKRLSSRRESNLNLETTVDEIYSSLEKEIQEKDEIIYNICTKYLKMKASKITLQNKIVKLQNQSQKICENIILILQENREALDTVLNNLLKVSNISRSGKSFIKLLHINAKLHYENTQLKIRMTSGKEAYIKNNLSLPNFKILSYSNSGEKGTCVRKRKKAFIGRSTSTNANNFMRHSECLRNFKTIHNSLSPHCLKEKSIMNRSKSDTNLFHHK